MFFVLQTFDFKKLAEITNEFIINFNRDMSRD